MAVRRAPCGSCAGPTQCSKSTNGIPQIVYLCCRKGDPFQDLKLCSCLILGSEFPEETHVLTKQESLLGKGARAESREVREPRRTALPWGWQSWVLQYFGHLMGRANSLEKKPWCWEWLRAREGDDRGWDGWMASPNQWTWVWMDSRSWWWTGRAGMLQFMGLWRVGHNWVTELNRTEMISFQVVFSQSFWLRVFPGGVCLDQPRWMSARRILGGGWTCGISFWPFPNSSSWWWLISSVFLTSTSCKWLLWSLARVGSFSQCASPNSYSLWLGKCSCVLQQSIRSSWLLLKSAGWLVGWEWKWQRKTLENKAEARLFFMHKDGKFVFLYRASLKEKNMPYIFITHKCFTSDHSLVY